jgi:hypothetical protein
MRLAPILVLLATACSKDGDDSEGCESTVWYGDADGDGIGVADDTVEACSLEEGYSAESGDCDDTQATVAPGLDEVCDGLDNDCNEQIDDGVGQTYYTDADGDGHGAEGPGVVACEPPVGQVASDDDCDDTNDTVFLGAPEICDGIDNDCDDLDDSKDPDLEVTTWYLDADEDGYGDPKAGEAACTQPKGHVADGSDCDDADAAVNPAASEVCYDGFDNNCDETDGEGCASCGDLSLLAYVDWDSKHGAYPIEDAAAELGAAITVLHYKEEFGFAKEVAGAWADVVILDSAWYGMDSHSGVTLPTAVEDAIAVGSLLIFAYWDLANHSSLPATLGVGSSDAFYAPRAIYAVDGSPIFAAVESLPEPTNGTDEIGVNGQVNVALDTKTSQVLATFDDDPAAPAIVSTMDGQVIVNGYGPIDYDLTDADADSLSEATELYINELAWIANCAP